MACARDLEGVVAKWAHGSYQTDGRSTSWLKVKNPDYSQIVDRDELFDRRAHEGVARRRFAAPLLSCVDPCLRSIRRRLVIWQAHHDNGWISVVAEQPDGTEHAKRRVVCVETQERSCDELCLVFRLGHGTRTR